MEQALIGAIVVEENLMKNAKQLVYFAPLALLIAGCAAPVKPDTTISEWQSEGQLPATGRETERVYTQTETYPMVNEPKIIIPASRRGSHAEDLALGDEIRQRVAYDRGLAPSLQRVTITVKDGAVTLQGTVKSDFDARLIVDDLREVPGVAQIRNDLEINPNWY